MTWRHGESYDDWDAIEESLWKSIVVSVLTHAVQTDRPGVAPILITQRPGCALARVAA